jgi:hypothetical protein
MGMGASSAAIPDTPTIGTITQLTGSSVTVAFTPSTLGANATSFTATSSPGSITASSATSPITVTGLTADTPYTFTVRATNANGNSQNSNSSNSFTIVKLVPPTVSTMGVGGGGSGGFTSAGGGGGGGGEVLVNNSFAITANTNYQITIGGGGQSPYNPPSSYDSTGRDGGDTIRLGSTARGGKHSLGNPNYGTGGASGNGNAASSGGGGAGAAASSGTGGAGVTYNGVEYGKGGSTGGGSGVGASTAQNTGGGGGGRRSDDGPGVTTAQVAGKSGLVIVRYSTDYKDATVGSGLTHTKTTSGSDTVYTFTGGSGTISWS